MSGGFCCPEDIFVRFWVILCLQQGNRVIRCSKIWSPLSEPSLLLPFQFDSGCAPAPPPAVRTLTDRRWLQWWGWDTRQKCVTQIALCILWTFWDLIFCSRILQRSWSFTDVVSLRFASQNPSFSQCYRPAAIKVLFPNSKRVSASCSFWD